MLNKLRIFSYLLWIAVILICISIVWNFLGESLPHQVNTFGLIIQLIGVISVVLILAGNEKLTQYATSLEDAIEQGIDTLMLQPLVSHTEHPKSYTVIIIIKLLLFSICNLAVYLATKYLAIESIWLFILLFGLLLLYLYIWAWSFLLIIIFRLLRTTEPALLGKVFETCDYGFSMIAVMIFLLVFITIRDFSSWLSKATIVDKIAVVTLPLIFAGTVFQLLGAFLL